MTRRIFAFVSLLSVLSCNKLDETLIGPNPPVPPPPTADISADLTTVLAGSDVVLTVAADSFANTGEISPIAVQMLNGNTTVQPQETTTYVFKVTGEGGSAVDAVTVNVIYPLPTASLVASPDTISAGGSATLTASSTDADNGFIIPTGAIVLNDSIVVNPQQTTTYLYVVSGRGGVAVDTATVTVVADTTGPPPPPPPPPPTAQITASPNPTCPGCEATIIVMSTGGTTGTVVWPGGQQMILNGQFASGAIDQTTTFVFGVVGPGGSAQDSVTITIQ